MRNTREKPCATTVSLASAAELTTVASPAGHGGRRTMR
ncbi:Uncharacterised protein [Mycobacteroides abscessus subsp. abscessus]|nr:Uncharacterised protein [Mycobacteroides abscessus subsp. abscessus]